MSFLHPVSSGFKAGHPVLWAALVPPDTERGGAQDTHQLWGPGQVFLRRGVPVLGAVSPDVTGCVHLHKGHVQPASPPAPAQPSIPEMVFSLLFPGKALLALVLAGGAEV